jgi:hypothetical protein
VALRLNEDTDMFGLSLNLRTSGLDSLLPYNNLSHLGTHWPLGVLSASLLPRTDCGSDVPESAGGGTGILCLREPEEK